MAVKNKTLATIAMSTSLIVAGVGFVGVEYQGYRNTKIMEDAVRESPQMVKLKQEGYVSVYDASSFDKSNNNSGLLRVIVPTSLENDAVAACNNNNMDAKVQTIRVYKNKDWVSEHSAVKCELREQK